jgi:signal transduction histidine kinase
MYLFPQLARKTATVPNTLSRMPYGSCGQAIRPRSIKATPESAPFLPMPAAHAASSKLPAVWQYLLATALVAGALFLSLVLQEPFGNPFWFFFPVAVIAATWYCGKGPGWVAVGLSTVLVLYYFIPPPRSFSVKPRDIPFFLAFAACQVVASRLVSWRRESEDSLRRARDELEIRVAERTEELKQANEALLNQIEEQKRTQEALLVTRTELTRVARITTIGELTASIAHEVNQPLAAVVANGDACMAWLSHSTPNLAEARSAAERMIQGATRASEVIVRIRSLINKATPERTPVDINKTIEETVALANSQALGNKVSIVFDLSPDLPAVRADRIQLQQVILNLVVNGIEAMTSVTDRPRQLFIRSHQEKPGEVRVSIEDTGIGVSSDAMGRLFEPFYTTRQQGMGMGLPISRSIIEAHGGRLWAESVPGRGSVFQFTLPSEAGHGA